MARFDFKRRRRRGSTEPQRLRLVVSRRALRPDEYGGIDELALIEQDYRMNGHLPVIFEESDDNDAPVS
jgi:hypothetical protein